MVRQHLGPHARWVAIVKPEVVATSFHCVSNALCWNSTPTVSNSLDLVTIQFVILFLELLDECPKQYLEASYDAEPIIPVP